MDRKTYDLLVRAVTEEKRKCLGETMTVKELLDLGWNSVRLRWENDPNVPTALLYKDHEDNYELDDKLHNPLKKEVLNLLVEVDEEYTEDADGYPIIYVSTNRTINNIRLLNRITKDAEKLEKKILKMKKKEIFNLSYSNAEIFEICGCFTDFIFNEDFLEQEEDVLPNIKTLLEFKGNLIEAIKEKYNSFNHPDRYDFWGYYEGYSGTYEVIQVTTNWICDEIKAGKKR